MKVNEVLQCSFPSWYERFSNVTIESIILDLPEDVMEYLTADGIHVDWDISHDDQFCASACSHDDSTSTTPIKRLNTAFKNDIDRSIETLGHVVFPKLNWSSPKDAIWITPGRSLKCTNADEIFLLLKSSDFIMHDLTEPFLECCDIDQHPPMVHYKLVLRKWLDIDKSNEFRCFVKDNQIAAISQRHANSYFPSLAENEGYIRYLDKSLRVFFDKEIKSKFPLDKYVFDAYVESDKILLLDFNPWGIITDPLLYTWDELNSIKPNQPLPEEVVASSDSLQYIPAFRIITDATIEPLDPYSGLCCVPLEYHKLALDMHSEGKEPFETMLDLMRDQRLSDDEDMDK